MPILKIFFGFFVFNRGYLALISQKFEKQWKLVWLETRQ